MYKKGQAAYPLVDMQTLDTLRRSLLFYDINTFYEKVLHCAASPFVVYFW